jgi:CheY-like chemotaxis protein
VGSTFTASIPLATAQHLPSEPAADETPAVRSPVSVEAPSKTLLYIEDNRSNVRLMQQLIGRRPHWHMLVADDGALGLELITTRPDLVLLDLHLPDMDGIEVLHHVRADPRTTDVQVVVVSADANPHQSNACSQPGPTAT